MRLDVYQTDADAFEAAADRAVARMREAAASGPVTVALSGGRSGRGIMLALAARSDAPWDRIEWFWADERCVAADDPRSNVRVARDSMLGPRGITAARIHPPPVDVGDAEQVARAYAATIGELVRPAFDLVLLGVGVDGHVASLMPGGAALRAAAPVAGVPATEVATEPRVARVTITPPLLQVARLVIVAVTGAEKAPAVGRILRGPLDPPRTPAQLVRPGTTVEWFVDRDAAGELLRDARAAPQ